MASIDVTDTSLLFRLRVVVYVTLVLLSFFIFVSIGVMMDRFQGFCPLYAGYHRAWYPASASRCNYPMVIAILFQFLYLIFRLVVIIMFHLGKLAAEMFLLSDKMELVYVGVDAIGFFLTFIGACILSAGTGYICSNFNACDIFDWYSATRVAQAGAWLSTFLWLFIAVWEFLFIWKTGKIPFLNKSESSPPKQAEKPS